ncbi:MAG: PEP-CTERM sorting domain-containing protein [Phycisphaeraceae bacterium]
MGLKTTFSAAVVAGLVVSPAMAAVTTSTDAAPGGVVVSQPNQGPNGWDNADVKGGAGEPINHYGSTFESPSDFDLGGVTVLFGNGYETHSISPGSADVTATVSIYTATDFNDFNTYTEIGSGSGVMPTSVDDQTYVTTIFDSAVALTDGNMYAFLFNLSHDGDEGEALARVRHGGGGTDHYADGGVLFISEDGVNDGSGVGFNDDGDVVDATFWIHDASVIPEPASLALLGLGGLAMLGRRRRIA